MGKFSMGALLAMLLGACVVIERDDDDDGQGGEADGDADADVDADVDADADMDADADGDADGGPIVQCAAVLCIEGSCCIEGCGGVDPRNAQCIPGGDTVFCTQIYDPVCGCDGRTYGNSCTAHRACVAIDYDGECRSR